MFFVRERRRRNRPSPPWGKETCKPSFVPAFLQPHWKTRPSAALLGTKYLEFCLRRTNFVLLGRVHSVHPALYGALRIEAKRPFDTDKTHSSFVPAQTRGVGQYLVPRQSIGCQRSVHQCARTIIDNLAKKSSTIFGRSGRVSRGGAKARREGRVAGAKRSVPRIGWVTHRLVIYVFRS